MLASVRLYLLAMIPLILNPACSNRKNKALDQYTITITDELHPAGLLPECMDLNSEGKLIFRSSRFNDDGTLYQKNFFIELNHKQSDSIQQLLELLINTDLTPMPKNEFDSVVYKVNIDWMLQGQRSTHLLIGSRFPAPLNQLISYCQKLPDVNHHYKLKESHYFSTDEICSGSGKSKN
jgi:hypothetical protein